MYTEEQNIRYTHFLHELWNEFKLKSYYLILDDSKKRSLKRYVVDKYINTDIIRVNDGTSYEILKRWYIDIHSDHYIQIKDKDYYNNHNNNSRQTESDLTHFKEIMDMLKSKWSGITAEARNNMTTVNEDPTQRKDSMNEFKATWSSADSNSDGRLTREEFCVFNHRHLCNIKSRLGWAPELTKSDSELIWESINALETNPNGIGLEDYGRYHTVMKMYIN